MYTKNRLNRFNCFIICLIIILFEKKRDVSIEFIKSVLKIKNSLSFFDNYS